VFAAWLPKISGSKIILDIHDIVPELFADKFGAEKGGMTFKALAAIEGLSAAFSDHIIISNDIWHETYTARSAPKSKCSVIINYPDPSIFSVGKYSPQKNSRQVLLYPGSLNWHQGLDVAIRAFSLIKDRVPMADLHIYGDGPAKPALAEMIRKMRLEDRICLKNGLPIEEIAPIMATATCGIVPKRSDGFGNQAFSTKTLEFMALGVPLLVSETEIDRYYFDDSMILFFRSGDECDLADKMALLLENEDVRSKLVRNSLMHVTKNNWDVKKDSYLELIDSLTNGKPINRTQTR
jgi:glycosyltransferase involved in cell wall biosynthesis